MPPNTPPGSAWDFAVPSGSAALVRSGDSGLVACDVRSCVTMAKRIEDLPIYQKVMEFWLAVNALLEKPTLSKDRDLLGQISRANDSISSNMVEGFEQGTDRAFANFLTHSKASVAEVRQRLKQAHLKRYITLPELQTVLVLGEALSKMLGGFIKYLRRCDWRDRGQGG
jgi:four helix bundle protein